MALSQNDYAYLDTPVFKNYTGYIKIVEENPNEFVCTYNGVHRFCVPKSSNQLTSIPVNTATILKAGFIKIDGNSLGLEGDVYAYRDNTQINVAIQHHNNDWILNIDSPQFATRQTLDKISAIDEIQHHVSRLCQAELILSLLPTIINKRLLHDRLMDTFKQSHTLQYHPHHEGLTTQNAGYIDYDYLSLTPISQSAVSSIDFSKFNGNECQVVVTINGEHLQYFSGKSLADIQANNPSYNNLSTVEKQQFLTLFNQIQDCITDSLKC